MVPIGKANGIEVFVAETPKSVEVYSERKGWSKMYSDNIAELATALARAQAVVEGAKKEATNPAFARGGSGGTKYANLEAVWDAIREPFTKEGLSIVQFPCEAPVGYIGLRTVLLHKSGQFLEDRFYMPLKDATNPQAAGSAITYARRYSLMAVAGIAPVDDDGNEAATVDTKGLVKQFRADFEAAVTVDEKKAVAINLRNSPLAPDDKTPLLTEFGNTIKQLMGKNN